MFFAKSQVQNLKKSGNHEIEIRIVQRHERGSENSKKGLSIENRDKKVGAFFATRGSLGVFLTKNTKKNMKMLHVGVLLKIINENRYKEFP